jgi:2',3'-cyclic-nucleotide 2'-phosphodiesterase (5'-nucleotidase family)
VLTALPYPNQVFVYRLRGSQVQELLDISVRHRGTNFHAQLSGVRLTSAADRAVGVQVQERGVVSGWHPLDPDRLYEVAVNDFTADLTPRYREFLADEPRRATGLELRETLMAAIRTTGHVAGALDGRIAVESAPAGVGV